MDFPVTLEHREIGTLTVKSQPAYDKAKALGFAEPKVPEEFPKTKYGPDGKTTTVADAQAEAALGEEWHNHPVEGEHFNVA